MRPSDLSNAAYALLVERVTANQTRFDVYQDADSGLNHGFPSGLFGSVGKMHLNTACVDDPSAVSGCSSDPSRLDRARGTVLSIAFDPLLPGEFAGVNFYVGADGTIRRLIILGKKETAPQSTAQPPPAA